MEGEHPAGCGGLTESDVGHNPAPAEDGDSDVAALGEGRDAFVDVGAAADFEDVAAEGVRAFLGDDDGRLGLVLGTGRSAPGAASGAGRRLGDLDVSGWVLPLLVV